MLVFDIGGGSTELIWVDLSRLAPGERRAAVRGLSPAGGLASRASRRAGRLVTDWISVPMGVSTLCDQVAGAAAEPARFAEMAARFEAALAPFAPYGAARARR